MISDARGGHVSPGIYTEEKDVTYSVKSLGITSLGLVGETLYGPAFENVEIQSWSEFVDYFGGTSPEKFKGTGLPKYELPYIAKSYLEESKRLNVVRVLGLSGYHAGPCWVITCKDKPLCVLRSKMSYEWSDNPCEPNEGAPTAIISSVTISEYTEKQYDSACVGTATGAPVVKAGYFCLEATDNNNTVYKYNVTLDSNHSNYIYNVISSSPEGTTPIYIEALFENSWDGESQITSGSVKPVKLEKEYYMVDFNGSPESGFSGTAVSATVEYIKEVSGNPIYVTGIKSGDEFTSSTSGVSYYYTIPNIDLDDYMEGYRAAQTPWIVSEAMINENEEGNKVCTMKKLFKLITISDGNIANTQIKVSIEKIKPSTGEFDVVVRDFYDSDVAPIVLERFSRCNLVEGDSNYVAFKIGTSDGGYVSKSKYILVEMADSEDLRNSVPAGFLGYPMPKYGCNSGADVTYNTKFNAETRAKKQYFGFSNLTGIETDVLSYKGRQAYTDGDIAVGKITNGFHMDSQVGGTVFVDEVSGYTFSVVSSAMVGNEKFVPRIINSQYMNETIYSDLHTRKFTVCFYGGFDGWDVHRLERTNTDKFKATKYNVSGTMDDTSVFTKSIRQNDLNLPLNLPTTAITSDYYAYLAGYRVFANPQDIDINLFATPGIDWYNNALLTEEVIEMIEDSEDGRGGDALYIMTSPTDMDAQELAEEFEALEFNSSYACTYAPWVMYYDNSNKRYLNLPVTKDVVRNMAATDNNSYPWFAPAGTERGNVNCVKAIYKTTLAEEDALYGNQINPVKSFAQDGVKIWGNKTAYGVNSPLNRINVRRLMIRVKKLITNAAKNLLFTQYDDTLDKQFRGLIEPILSDVKSNKGIVDYRIMTEVTPETRDQHILPAKILIKPTPALEYISISFVVYPESVSFDEN